MADIGAGLVHELKTLRKGRGLLVRQIGERVGPALCALCGVAAGDSQAEIRAKVTDHLKGVASELPADLRLAVLAAFAIHQDARLQFYQERVRWLAEQLGRDERTARRRIDEGIERLAELAVAPGPGGDPATGRASLGWHVEYMHVAVVLDQGPMEAFESRRVVADRDDLAELDLGLTLTLPPDQFGREVRGEFDVGVLYGGTLVRRRRESADRFGFALTLPRTLKRADKYEFAWRYRVPEGEPVAPHFVSVLRTRCEVFDLRVRFGLGEQPRLVRRIEGVFQRDVDDPVAQGEPVPLDSAGETHVTFRDLVPNLAYGVRWER